MSYNKTIWTPETPVTPNRLNNLETGVYEASLLTGYTYKGSFDASGGTYPESPSDRDYWIITVAGTLGGKVYAVGDELAYVDGVWFRRNQWDAAVFEPWQDITILVGANESSGDYYNAQVTKNKAGEVRLRGRISLTYLELGTAIATIPEGFRPSKHLNVTGYAISGPDRYVVPFSISPIGHLSSEFNLNTLHDVSIDGISYLLD